MTQFSAEERQTIWDLYFDKMYNYEKLERYFKGKYDYHQLKSIIMEMLENGKPN